MMLVIYVASLVRSILALHKLIDNKEQRLAGEREAGRKLDKAAADKAKDGKEDGKDKDGKGEAKKGDKENEKPGAVAGDAKGDGQ